MIMKVVFLVLQASVASTSNNAAVAYADEHRAADQRGGAERDQGAEKPGLRALRKEGAETRMGGDWGWGGDGHGYYGSSLGHWLEHMYDGGVNVPKACGPFCPAPAPAPAPTTPTCKEECLAKCAAAGVAPADCSCDLVVLPQRCPPLTIANPSFETDPCDDWQDLIPLCLIDQGSGQLGSVSWISGLFIVPANGNYSLGMQQGSVTQVLDTVPGCTYKISFEMANNPFFFACIIEQGTGAAAAPQDPGTNQTTIEVSVNGGTSELFNSSTPVPQWDGTTYPAAIDYETKVFEFTAASTTTVLMFKSRTTNATGHVLVTQCAGPILDNIVVL